MQMLVLLAFIVTLTLLDAASATAGPLVLAGSLLAYLAGAAALGLVNGRVTLAALLASTGLPQAALRRHNALLALGQVWLLGGLAGLLVLGLARWIDDEPLGRLPLLRELAGIAPFLAGLLLAWLLDFPVYRQVRLRIEQLHAQAGETFSPGWRLGEYLSYNFRHHVLFVAVPLALIIAANDLLRFHLCPRLSPTVADYVLAIGSVLTAGAVFLISPALIVRVWKTAPLPPGPLRNRLEDLCRRLRIRYRDIRIWQSSGTIANAGVMGIIGSLRYILLSDALLERLPPEQIESVFAHEAGHVRYHHIAYSAAFAVVSVVLCTQAGTLLAARGGGQDWLAEALSALLLVPAWALGFGWISRRFERQSDVLAAWYGGGPVGDDPGDAVSPQGAFRFAQALDRVACLNGIAPGQRNWRHGSIEWRISYILWLAGRGGSRRQIDRLAGRIKVALLAGLAVSAALVVLGAAMGE